MKFAPRGKDSFYDVVKRRVEAYFENNHLSPYSDTSMKVKTVAMLSMYFVPYLVIVSGVASVSLWLFYALWLLMGLGIVGIGTSIMHDSNHGAYTESKGVNGFLGSLLNLIGGYAPNWRIQHNVLHHTYTNIDGLDEDIETGFSLLRMSPHATLKSHHRYQHLYAWALYCLMNLYWVIAKDYIKLVSYNKSGLLVKEKLTLRKGVIQLSLLKVLYIGYIIVLPIMFAGVPWYHAVLGFVAMHVVAGFSLACIFQPAHVVETSDFAEPNDQSKMENNWAVHQVLNTTDFAPDNKLVGWFIGGLNYQIEHHLFPQICHVHYPAIAKIVAEVAREHDIPYQVMPTFRSALGAHARMLKMLGKHEEVEYCPISMNIIVKAKVPVPVTA